MEIKFGLIGKNLSHSFSKKYFENKFKVLNLQNFFYELWELDSIENIRKFIAEKKNVSGFNITIPYKEEIIKYLDVVTENVKETGACNCVLIKNNKWTGYNTDWWGFLKMTEGKLESHQHSAMILGTGGAAKAIAYALNQMNIGFVFVSRRVQKNLSAPCITYNELNENHFKQYPVIINTTPLGMYPDIHSTPDIPIDFINEKNFVIDIIYNPEKTLLLKEAEKRGAKILNGKEMLYLQAEKSWYIWQETK